MVQRDWQSSTEGGALEIKGLRGGTIAETTNFLTDLEKAHNALCDLYQWLGNSFYDMLGAWPRETHSRKS